MLITLEQVKARLKIDADDEDDDLQLLIDAVISTFEQVTNRKLYAPDQAIPDDVKNGIHWNPSIMQGALVLIAHWHKFPESAGDGSDIPRATDWAWRRHRFINT